MSASHTYNDSTKLHGNLGHTVRPLVVFGEDWGSHPSSTQHIVSILGESRQVIWINSIGLRKPRLNFKDLGRIFNKLQSFIFSSLFTKKITNKSIPDNLIIISPLVIPCANSYLSIKISRFILKKQIDYACRRIVFTDPIVWSSLPTSVDYLDIFNKAPCVYYCGDDFNSLEGVDHKFVSEKEKELVDRSRYVFTASEYMLSRFPREKGVNIPHGVDYSMFSKRDDEIPFDLPRGKPIAGFYGSISTWLDQQLLVDTIQSLPHWDFVFIGKVDCNVDSLLDCNNVKFLGVKDHHELPRYIQNWNVAMLPFKNNKQIQMCNPLKLREYLASGTPVVSTDFNALRGYRDYIQVSNKDRPFKDAILLASADILPTVNFDKVNSIADVVSLTKSRSIRQSSVINESWESRALDLQIYLSMC
jgi:glycosyltransferase involved in cell wall biosynthesis